MNNKFIYIPITLLVVVSIGLISFEIPHLSLMIGIKALLLLASGLTVLTVAIFYFNFVNYLTGEEKYVAFGSSILFSFVIWFAICTWGNRAYANSNCSVGQYQVLHYEPRYAAAYGNITNDKVEANQFIVTLSVEGVQRTFTLREALTLDGVTNTINLEFCKGVLGTRYIRE